MILEHLSGKYIEDLNRSELSFVYKNGHINPYCRVARIKQIESNNQLSIDDKMFSRLKSNYILTKEQLNVITIQRCFMDIYDIYKNINMEKLDDREFLETLKNLIVFIFHLKKEGYKEFVEMLDMYFKDKMSEFTNLTSDQLRNSWRIWRYPVIRKKDENRLAENKMNMVSQKLKEVQYDLAEAITPAEIGNFSTAIERLEKYYSNNVNNSNSKIFSAPLYRMSVLLYLLRIADKANEKTIYKKYGSEVLKVYSLTHRHFTYFKPVELFILLTKNNMMSKQNAIEEIKKFIHETISETTKSREVIESNLLVPHLRLNFNNIEFLTEFPSTLAMYTDFRFGDYLV